MYDWATLLWRRICALSYLTQDLILYLLAAVFAILNGVATSHADYREWGIMAFVAYVVASLIIGLALARRRRHEISSMAIRHLRVGVVFFLTITAVLVPLLSELTWRATGTENAHAQQEVAVIERAGDRVALGTNPYPKNPTNFGINPSSDAHNVDNDSYFPYLPGMAVFGLLNATTLPHELGDARVLLVAGAIIIFLVALHLTRASPERKILALQFFMVLPTGALPMVTGGDDLPVIALMALSLVLLVRRAPLAAGLVAAVACSLKLTAWPIALLSLFVTHGLRDDRSQRRYLLGLALLVPIVVFGAIGNEHAFIENALRFPLGLTKVKSPAASPLLGQFLVTLVPHDRRAITLVLALVGLVIVGVALVKFPPRTVVSVTRFAAFVLCVATVLAPATRFGYLVYPTVLYVWSYVLTGYDQPRIDDGRGSAGGLASIRDLEETKSKGA